MKRFRGGKKTSSGPTPLRFGGKTVPASVPKSSTVSCVSPIATAPARYISQRWFRLDEYFRPEPQLGIAHLLKVTEIGKSRDYARSRNGPAHVVGKHRK